LHVASSEREELLGEYLVRRGRLTRAQLEQALGTLSSYGGRLGDTLIGIGMVDAVGRVSRHPRPGPRTESPRSAAGPKAWSTFYRGTSPQPRGVPAGFGPSKSDDGGCHRALQRRTAKTIAGGHETPVARSARGSDPSSTRARFGAGLFGFHLDAARRRLTVNAALERLIAFKSGHDARTVGAKEAAAALLIADLLGVGDVWGVSSLGVRAIGVRFARCCWRLDGCTRPRIACAIASLLLRLESGNSARALGLTNAPSPSSKTSASPTRPRPAEPPALEKTVLAENVPPARGEFTVSADGKRRLFCV